MSIRWDINLGFDRIRNTVDDEIDPALVRGMETLHAAVTPLVPIDTGNLVGSGDVGIGDLDAPATPHVAHLYYPGPYALYQHEGVYFRRPATFGATLTHEHGESFFLIRPAAERGPAIIRQVADDILKAI